MSISSLTVFQLTLRLGNHHASCYSPAVGIFRASLVLLLFAIPANETAAQPPAPKDLPQYHLKLTLDPELHKAEFTQSITWTNRSTKPTDELVFNFYPLYRIPEGDYLLLAKTLELLRLNPRDGIDRDGRHGDIKSVRYKPEGPNGGATEFLSFEFRADMATALSVKLPHTVNPGQKICVEIHATIRLPEKQGRWGVWQGVSFLTNALPVAAYHDDAGWHAVPFVPWHQPFWNEAGNYTAQISLPANQKLACSAIVDHEEEIQNGWKVVHTKPFVGRDFAIVASAAFKEYTEPCVLPDGRIITLKCLAFERHEFYAKEILKIVREAIPVYSAWFGSYPYDQFTVVESFFGWNGNECSGLVMIDERVFNMPHLGRGYVEYLVSHETCHQWWYNYVGTNGYSETFMDEGAATYFTHRMLDKRHGKNNAMVTWPGLAKNLPGIERENYRYASYVGAIRRNDAPAAAGDLPNFGHLVGLFSGAYDRGSKVFGMVEARLGEAAFIEFIRGIVKKYGWRVLSAVEFRTELETFTGQSWAEFFDQWVYGKGLTDWSIESVNPNVDGPPRSVFSILPNSSNPYAPHRVSVIVKQTGELTEPTTVGFQLKNGTGFPIRIPVGRGEIQPTNDEYALSVESLGKGRWKIGITLKGEPEQIQIDPDSVIPDSNIGNNSWRFNPKVSLTPVYSLLNEGDLTSAYDRWNFGAGPWVWGQSYPDPWYTRSSMLGVRAGAYRTQQFAGGAYAGIRSDYRDAVVGVDGLIDHWPQAKMQLGYNWEQRIGGPWFGSNGEDTAKRASLFARYVFQYGSSLYLPPIHYVEGFGTYQDNFLPNSREKISGSQRPNWSWMTGAHYRLNLYTPYWDPECGIWLDGVYGAGQASLGSTEFMHQFRGEVAAVRKLPDGYGRISDARLAVRGVAMGALPARGDFFALGGGTLFRGFDLAQRQGNFLWAANAEIRLPVVRNVEWDYFDRVAGIRNIWFAPFYDVGAVFNDGRRVNNIAHAVGGGLRVDISVFGFIERATLRLDVAKTLNMNTPFQFWFGVQHPF